MIRGLAEVAGNATCCGDYRMSRDAVGIALGFAGETGRWQLVAASGGAGPVDPGFGVSGWSPETVLAASFAPHGVSGQTDVLGLSFASELDRPMGWDGSGVLALKGDGLGIAWRRIIVDRKAFRLDLTARMTHLSVRDSPLLHFDDTLLASTNLDMSYQPHPLITVKANLGTERPVSRAAGRIRAATSVDESGRVIYRDVAIDGRDLLSFDKAALKIGFSGNTNTSYGFGFAAVQDGFGRTETLTGVRMDLEF